MEAEGLTTEEVVETVVAAANKGRPDPPEAGAITPIMEEMEEVPPGAQDTPLIPLPAAVTTTTGGEPKVGSAWPLCHVLGRTGSQASLKRIEKMTSST